MRIGMFLDTAFPPDSRVENEAISLIKAGHEVHLFSLDYEGRKSKEIVNGIQVHRYKADKLTYKLSALAYTFPFFHNRIKKLIRQFIEEIQPDVIHIHDMVIAKAVMDVNKGLPVVLDLHENRPEIMKHYKHVNEGLGKWLISTNKWNAVQDELIKRCDHLILVTEEAKKVVADKGLKNADQITVVPNTILPEVYLNYKIDDSILERFKDTYNLVYLGDTSLRRGTDTAIKAIALLKDKIPNVKLILVGESSVDDQLMSLAKELAVDNHVSFEGWQDGSLFSSYVEASDGCLSPLKRNPHHDTTFANKLFQYMAMGKPVVVSDSTTQANVVNSENCGLVFEAENERELADQIIKLYEDKELSKQLGANGAAAVKERWNWDITSRDLLKMYVHLK
ncbi:glycosyltransferase family 4 protein [Fulvivirga sp.]|uniref:glycosyltransferase family 4 protein n=1 Tax=Fulvivirga sp. TaxID=1931237 RepID=UPI0032F02C79